MYKENDNMNMEDIERYMEMSQEERDKLIAEMEKEIWDDIKKTKKHQE